MFISAIIATSLTSLVNPFVGTAATGHTTPAATCPFGMVQPGPDTGNFAWKYCSGYQYADTTLIGFSQTHLSGTGAADLGDVRILPYAGGTNMPATVALDKSTERVSPGYYAVNAGGVGVEISASPRVAFYRLRFPAGERARVKIDPATGLVRRDNERLRIPRNVVMQMSKDVIVGDYHRIGWGDREVHWRLKASCPFELVSEMTDNGRHWRIDFPEGTRTVELRIALSATSDAGAERNLAAEGGASFDEARAAADAAWNELFGRLVIDADEATKRIFYTALYHVCFQPNLFSDVGEPERYSTFSYWDTFRAAHPLYTLLVPEKIPAFVESELDQFGRTGHLSSWSLWGRDVQGMIATHSIPPLVDACLKGLVDGGTERRVYEAVKNALKEKHADKEKEDWDVLDRFGYYPYDAVRESASRTLECAYDDACAQRLAEKLGEKDDAAFFAKRAGYWRNVFDSKTGFARPRMCDGAWTEPFDPTDNGAYFGFTEANSWQYTWHVMHDIPGLMAAMGGKERFAAKLRELFEQPYRRGRRWTADITGEIGQYAHGNEPSHHIPFLFFLCGQWDAGEKWVRHICETLYRDAPDGLCGNDDCGQISAWYVFAALGFYPVDPCGGDYVQGTPLVKHRFVKPMALVPRPRARATEVGAFVTLSFGEDGQLSSIQEIKTGRELVGEKCPFMDVTLGDGRIFPSTGMREAANGNLVFTFAPLAGEAEIRLVPFDGGWTIETVRFDVKDVKTWTVAHVKPGCKRWYGDMACLVSDETSGVALRAYDPLLRTACDEIPNRDPHSLYDAPDLAFYPTPEQVASGLMIRADAPDSFVGRKFGLCAGPRGKLRDMLKAMTLAAGVPWSKAGGAWALDAECNRGSYLFTTFMSEGSAKDWLDMLELGGFTAAHPYAWWVNYGLYDLNAELFPHGLDGLKEGFRVFHGAGYRVDLHHLTHCIQYIEPCFLPEVTVDPDDLIERCTYTLARPFAPGDTTMYVNEKPWDGHTVIMKSHANGNALLVGREVVQYHDMSFERPYCFSNISRGKFRTQYFGDLPVKVSDETFPAGTKVKYLQQRYGSFYPKPGSRLMERVSSRIGEVFNACEADGVYFDGAEGMMTIYGTEKGRETTFRKFRQKDDEIICESACLYPYSWWYRSRIGLWDHAEWGAKRFVDEHIRCLDEYATKANLLRVNLGWWAPMMGCAMARQHFSDEMEYNGCKGAAIDAADGFQLPGSYGSVNTNSVHFHTEDQLAIFGWWERARLARAFTDEVMAKIRVPGDEFRLRQDESGLWRVAPQKVSAHAVKDAPYAAWTVDEPEDRRAELRVEALYAGMPYTGPQSKSILAPSDAPALESKSAPGVSVAVSRSNDSEMGETLVLEAANENGFRDGAWARVGKHYPVPYLGVEPALGLWVKGDGSGALLNVQLEQAITCYHGYSEHYIRLDFTGWRYFALQLRERDAYDYFNHKWPYSHYRINTATEVYRTEIMGQTIEYVNLYLNDVPAGGKTRVEVTDVRSVGRREQAFRSGVVTLNGEDFAVPFEMKSTDVAELVDGMWTLINDAGTPVRRVPAAKMPRVRKGANALAWRAESADGYPRVEVTVLSVGDGDPAFKPGATKSKHLSVEAERPLVHKPSAGLVARQAVCTRPGETAALEFRILGPIDTPTLTVGEAKCVFPVRLESARDVLRCRDGRNWTVTRIDGISRLVLATGALPQAIEPISGTVKVSLSSADEAKAAARLSILKRYSR